jgi:hypothetical protein
MKTRPVVYPTRQERNVTDSQRQKAEELIASIEIAAGEITPRNGGNAMLIQEMLQRLNGLREVLGLERQLH